MSRYQSLLRVSTCEDDHSQSRFSDNVFNALRTYRDQEQQLTSMAKRIRKLQQNQLKTIQKCQNQKRLLNSLEKIRKQREQASRKLILHRDIIISQVYEQKGKNIILKQQNKQALNSVLTEIKNKRSSNFQFMRQQRQQNQMNLTKMKQLDLQEKRKMRDNVKEEEKSMKESRMTKVKLKIENVERHKERDMNDLQERGKTQGMQIQKLAKIEVQLMQRNDQSQIKSSQVKDKYPSVLKSQKLSLNGLTKKYIIESVYVHPLVKRIQKRMDKYNIQKAR